MEYAEVYIKNDGSRRKIEKGTTLSELSRQYHEEKGGLPALLAKLNNSLAELSRRITKDCEVELLDIRNSDAYRLYQRSVSFIMIYAAKEILGHKTRVLVEHSINKNFYCEIPDIIIDDEIIKKIEDKMLETTKKDIVIERCSVSLENGVDVFNELGMSNRADALKYVRMSNINLYNIGWFYDYLYGPMAMSTGALSKFKLVREGTGFLIQFPNRINPENLNEIMDLTKIQQVYKESSQWARILGVDTVGALNNAICSGNIRDIILISEALHEKKIANISDMITHQKKKIILIAGPSSSGKTTFAKRICTQLKVNCIKPYLISLDDYYLSREQTPVDSEGKPDFEALEAIDVSLFNNDMTALLNNEKIELPHFNFKTGKREYRGDFIKLDSNEVLVIEGIHGLNDRLTENIPAEDKFKIYISAITQLNIDEHNRIPTTDTRLIRRLVRDHNFRGFDAISTIDIWSSVVRGEERNIFPFQECADAFFNSALVYELCVLKQYAEPLLFSIGRRQPEYTEATRLIKFLDNFLLVQCQDIIPPNSIIREFIGGSCFN